MPTLRGFSRAGAACLIVLAGYRAALSGQAGKDYLTARPDALQWWREAKLGVFICWGPVSLKGTEIGWSRGGERRGRKGRGPIPVEVYDNLYKQFNPTRFNAKEWIDVVKASGAKYIIFLTKHHDGFCLFDSKLTDYKITSPHSPFRRDVTAEIAQACHDAGIRIFWYYSQPDWHHPDYRTANHARYIQYLHGQIRELLTRYGKIDGLWFDGLGGKAKDWDAANLFKLIRTLQPHALINNRCGLPGDFYTPEQHIGRFDNQRTWESCITLGTQWAWKPNDRVKSLKECIDILVRCVGGDGHLALTTNPMPDGRIEPRQVERFKQIGAWLKQHGESIYGTRGGPFRSTVALASTHRGSTVYVHILKWEQDAVTLPTIGKRILSSTVLGGGTATVKQSDEGIEIRVPKAHRQELDTIVVLELDGQAADLKLGKLRSGSVAAGKPARASNFFQKSKTYSPDKAFDDDFGTRWGCDWGTKAAWLEVDLGEPTPFARAIISEPYGRVQEFTLERKEGDAWRAFARGTTIGERRVLKFPPVTARIVRLNLLRCTEGPSIWEFQLFAPKK